MTAVKDSMFFLYAFPNPEEFTVVHCSSLEHILRLCWHHRGPCVADYGAHLTQPQLHTAHMANSTLSVIHIYVWVFGKIFLSCVFTQTTSWPVEHKLRCPFVCRSVPSKKFEMVWNGDFSSKTLFLKCQN